MSERMYWHYNRIGFLHGRFWWRPSSYSRSGFHAEWCVKPKLELGAKMQWAGFGDDMLQLSACVLGISLYLMFSAPILAPIYRRASARHGWETGFGLTPKSLHIDIASRVGEYNSRDPWWVRSVSVYFLDLLFGRKKYTKECGEKKPVLIPMQEGCYEAFVTMEECRWKRPMIPWASHKGRYADVEIPGGIPFSGKGENSWDCGDDGLFGWHGPARSIEDAIGNSVESVLTSRRQNGETEETRGRIVMARAKQSEVVK